MKTNGQRFARCAGVLGVCLLAAAAPAQITVTGISDEAIYNDGATFTVQTQAGYDYAAFLDSAPVAVGTPVAVRQVDYHELQVFCTNRNSQAVTSQLVQFIVRASARGSTEDGLPPWTPHRIVNSASGEFAGSHLRVIVPHDFPAGLEIPLVAWIENDEGGAVRVNGVLTSLGQAPIQLRRGVGSGFLSSSNSTGLLTWSGRMSGLADDQAILIETNTSWIPVAGTLAGSTVWPAGSRIAVTNTLIIPPGTTLTVGEGTIVRLNAGVNIQLNGYALISGTSNRPVCFVPANPAQPWGGFLLEASTSQLAATFAIFTRSGANPNWFGSGGRPGSHRTEQALFYLTNTPVLNLTDCAAVRLAGQLAHAVNGGTVTLTRFLMQRATTGGEFTGASFRVNDSAFIECPDDSLNFVDGDNDALYFVNGTHGFTNTLIGWTKDDGVDSGGSGAGLLNFQNCWFESIFHEGNSLSGTGKIVNHYGGVFLDCGQGLESGYDGPGGRLIGCLAAGNVVGGRFGDNYNWTYSGSLRATNSILIDNHRDVWGMTWDNWDYRSSAMDIRSNFLSAPNPYHPSNTVWQVSDGWRLQPFLTTPPGADVGIAILTPTAVYDWALITNALFVRLSSFSTNVVAVGYRIETPEEILAAGTLEFLPGETLHALPAPAAPPAGGGPVARIHISDPVHAEITGIGTVYFTGPPEPAPMQLQHLRFGDESVLFWADAAATLQQADDICGPWTDVAAAAPFAMTIDAARAQRFYRLRSGGGN